MPAVAAVESPDLQILHTAQNVPRVVFDLRQEPDGAGQLLPRDHNFDVLHVAAVMHQAAQADAVPEAPNHVIDPVLVSVVEFIGLLFSKKWYTARPCNKRPDLHQTVQEQFI